MAVAFPRLTGKKSLQKSLFRGGTGKDTLSPLNRNEGDKIRLDWWYGLKQIHCWELIVICPHTFRVSLAQLHCGTSHLQLHIPMVACPCTWHFMH